MTTFRIDENETDLLFLDFVTMTWIRHNSILINDNYKHGMPNYIWIDDSGVNFINNKFEHRRVPIKNESMSISNIDEQERLMETSINNHTMEVELNILYIQYILSLKLSQRAYRIILYLFGRYNNDYYDRNIRSDIMQDLNLSKSEVSRGIKELVGVGLLEKKNKESTSNTIFKLKEFTTDELINLIEDPKDKIE